MEGNLLRRTLMCRDHEVVDFTYDPLARRFAGNARVIERNYLPFGCLGHDGRFTSSRLASWLTARSIPATRPGLSSVLQRLDLQAPEELMAAGLGLSLSDQYWLKPVELTSSWRDINFFEHGFSPALGEAHAPHGPDSGSEALASLDGDVLGRSRIIADVPGRLDGIKRAIERNIGDVLTL